MYVYCGFTVYPSITFILTSHKGHFCIRQALQNTPLEPLWAGALGPVLALVCRALVGPGPCGLPWALAGWPPPLNSCRLGPCGPPPVFLRARFLGFPLGPCGAGPYEPPGPLWAGPFWDPLIPCCPAPLWAALDPCGPGPNEPS